MQVSRGGAFLPSEGVTALGLERSVSAMPGDAEIRAKEEFLLVVVDDVMSSFRVALSLLRASPCCTIFISGNAESRRVHRRSFPDSLILENVGELNSELTLKVRREHVRVKHLLAHLSCGARSTEKALLDFSQMLVTCLKVFPKVDVEFSCELPAEAGSAECSIPATQALMDRECSQGEFRWSCREPSARAFQSVGLGSPGSGGGSLDQSFKDLLAQCGLSDRTGIASELVELELPLKPLQAVKIRWWCSWDFVTAPGSVLERTASGFRLPWSLEQLKKEDREYLLHSRVEGNVKDTSRTLALLGQGQIKAEVRELALGFDAGFTVPAVSSSELKHDAARSEQLRCNLLSRGIPVPLLEALLAPLLVDKGYRNVCSKSELFELKSENVELSKDPHQAGLDLVESFLRGVSYKGSDVRLNTGELMAPTVFQRCAISAKLWRWKKCIKWKWRHKAHINVLESTATYMSHFWRVRRAGRVGKKFLHLTDSYVGISVLSKRRSSSKVLNRVCRKTAALELGGSLFPVYGFCRSDDNPADDGLRT